MTFTIEIKKSKIDAFSNDLLESELITEIIKPDSVTSKLTKVNYIEVDPEGTVTIYYLDKTIEAFIPKEFFLSSYTNFFSIVSHLQYLRNTKYHVTYA